MNANSAILEPSREPVLKLDFEMPVAEHAELAQKIAWPFGSHPWLMPTIGIIILANTAFMAGLHMASDVSHPVWRNWLFGFQSLTMLFIGWNAAANNAGAIWLTRRFSRGASHTELELDPDGIRGVFEYPSDWHKDHEVKHINYTWRKVRKIHRPSDYVILEFHGGGTVTIPEREFASYGDLGQCLKWAEQGLAAQRKKPAFRHVAA